MFEKKVIYRTIKSYLYFVIKEWFRERETHRAREAHTDRETKGIDLVEYITELLYSCWYSSRFQRQRQKV